MTMAIRDENLFEATSPFTLQQHRGLAARDISSVDRNMFSIASMTLIPFVPISLIAVPPDALFQYLKGLLL